MKVSNYPMLFQTHQGWLSQNYTYQYVPKCYHISPIDQWILNELFRYNCFGMSVRLHVFRMQEKT